MSRKRPGFTLIELLVVIAIIALLVSILMPSLHQARRFAKIASCSVNMRSALLGCHLYSSDYADLPWNYTNKEAHDHVNPNDVKDGNESAKWYRKLDNSGWSNHRNPEGVSTRSYWRGHLIAEKYGSAETLGCIIPPADNTWRPTSLGNDVENDSEIRKAPPFIYRGRATSTDADLNTMVGGSIASPTGGFWEPTHRRTFHRPFPTGDKSKIILTCPVFTKTLPPPDENMQVQPHQATPIAKRWSELPGRGMMGHIVAGNVGWSDGRVVYADSKGEKFRYVHPDTGKIAITDVYGTLP